MLKAKRVVRAKRRFSSSDRKLPLTRISFVVCKEVWDRTTIAGTVPRPRGLFLVVTNSDKPGEHCFRQAPWRFELHALLNCFKLEIRKPEDEKAVMQT